LGLKTELWRVVIQAIEEAVPEYDKVNERVSLGRALKTRTHLADQVQLKPGMTVLDAGIGPGTMSEIILTKAPGFIVVGLDASSKLLLSARERLGQSYGDRVHLVQGAFEALPFKDGCFNLIVSAYAFRDSRNQKAAINEFHRSSANEGAFAIVDLGKPHNCLKRALITIYVRSFMPVIAWLSMSGTIRGNPWRMIFPTYAAIRSNRHLATSLRSQFTDVTMTEFALGGVVIAIARKDSGIKITKGNTR
jgi:demethylmenaquinone methyltransferase/2-methoxy-6-polyprenyl-1,4-benzoquinol methylase